MNLYVPIAIIVVSNIFYHICSKSVPDGLNPFAALTVTYVIGAVAAAIAFFVQNPGESLIQQYRQLNWSPFVLGLSIVGLEVGSIYMYKAGWNLSTGQLVHGAILAVCLIGIGCLFYHESISVAKVLGICACLLGLFLINK